MREQKIENGTQIPIMIHTQIQRKKRAPCVAAGLFEDFSISIPGLEEVPSSGSRRSKRSETCGVRGVQRMCGAVHVSYNV